MSVAPLADDLTARLRDVLARYPAITLAILFGSLALGRAHADSDIDLAVAARSALSPSEKMDLIGALAQETGRPVDLIDLRGVTEPLLGQIIQHGKRVLGSDTEFAGWLNRHLVDQADFDPYRRRVLAERRRTWIGI